LLALSPLPLLLLSLSHAAVAVTIAITAFQQRDDEEDAAPDALCQALQEGLMWIAVCTLARATSSDVKAGITWLGLAIVSMSMNFSSDF
jgi:hypothetical protein